MSINRMAALRLEVEAAERDATLARVQLAAGGGELSVRVRERWIPRALVGAGAALGYWFEGHLSADSRRSEAGSVARDQASGKQTSIDTDAASPLGIAGWLGLAMSALRLVETLRPLIERTIEARDASDASTGVTQSVKSERYAEPQRKGSRIPEAGAHADHQANPDPQVHVESKR